MSTELHSTALITGASRGLGLALARALAADGWNLIINSKTAGPLEAARAELSELTEVVSVPGDVAERSTWLALAQSAKGIGGLDLVVNNASILGASPQPKLFDYPIDTLESV